MELVTSINLKEGQGADMLMIARTMIDPECKNEKEAMQKLIKHSLEFYILMEKHVRMGSELKLTDAMGVTRRVSLKLGEKRKSKGDSHE